MSLFVNSMAAEVLQDSAVGADVAGPDVVRLGDDASVASLLGRFKLTLRRVEDNQPIPGTFWGDDEAGLIGNQLFARGDTPLHSVLHEASHFICMPQDRRSGLNTNAGGDYDEENAVCYLSILLADRLPRLGHDQMLRDMDRWGYSFRLGSAGAWFERDAGDAVDQLQKWRLIDAKGYPTYRVRR